MTKWKFSYGRAVDDPEKVVIPTVLFVSPQHEAFKQYDANGFSLSLGWWDFYARVSLITVPRS